MPVGDAAQRFEQAIAVVWLGLEQAALAAFNSNCADMSDAVFAERPPAPCVNRPLFRWGCSGEPVPMVGASSILAQQTVPGHPHLFGKWLFG